MLPESMQVSRSFGSRMETIQNQRDTTSLYGQMLDAVQQAVIATNLEGTILFWNPFAERLYGWSGQEVIGKNIMSVLVCSQTEQQAIAIMEALRRGESWSGEFLIIRKDGSTFFAEVIDSPIYDAQEKLVGIVGVSRDVSERNREREALARSHAELETEVKRRTESLRLLSARLLQMRDEERRRLARELHDSLGQQLTALTISLSMLGEVDPPKQHFLKECKNLLAEAVKETRTLSHLLHPPLLDEAGFASAAQWYVEGFAQRSGIAIDVDIPDDLGRLPGIELALFRVLQEGLTNVHRHSRASRVVVSVESDAEQVTLTIEDNGCGIQENLLKQLQQSGTAGGIGLSGMRERIRDAGGEFGVHSGDWGTRIAATLRLNDRGTVGDSIGGKVSRPSRSASSFDGLEELPEWLRIYRNIFEETNPAKLPSQVEDAIRAIKRTLNTEIEAGTSTTLDRRVLENALRHLRALHQERKHGES
jgi:two-component system NarL family sensor kinase